MACKQMAGYQIRKCKQNLLNLDYFFYEVSDLLYVVVRGITPDSFTGYYKGTEIDIFCYNKEIFAKRILALGNDYVSQGFEIKVTDCTNEDRVQIDFLGDGEIEFRFSLYGRFPRYKKVRIKEHLFLSVIENAQIAHRQWKDKQYPFYIPADVDNLLLRYIEYVEYYEECPDKVKHLNFILSAVEATPGRIKFLDKLHQYTDLPKCIIPVLDHSKPDPKVGQGIRYHAKGFCFAVLAYTIPEIVLRRVRRVYRKTTKIIGRCKRSLGEHLG